MLAALKGIGTGGPTTMHIKLFNLTGVDVRHPIVADACIGEAARMCWVGVGMLPNNYHVVVHSG